MMAASVESWATKTFGASSGQWPFSQYPPPYDPYLGPFTKWPLPIGKKSLIHDAEYTHNYAPPVFDMMPFEGDEYAALILPVAIGETIVTVIGLARVRDETGENRVFEHAGFTFLIRGADPDAKAVQVLVKHARYFFSRFEGRPLPGSMNAGALPVHGDKEAAQREVVAEARRLKKKYSSLSIETISGGIGVPYSTLRYWLKKYEE